MIAVLAAFSIVSLFDMWLSWRQMAYVQARRASVPPAFAGRITLADHQKAADYTQARGRLAILGEAAGLAMIFFWLLFGLDWLHGITDRAGLSALWGGVLFIAAVAIVGEIEALPFSIYGTFGIEQRFGFNRTSVPQFIRDLALHGAVSAVIGLPLLAGALWLMERMPGNWWLMAWPALMGLMLILSVVAPVWILPLFNRFMPLEDAALKARVERLAARCGLRTRGIYAIDGSKRSTHANAFVTGFGPTKRIALFDTLIQRHTPDEIEAVLAHEFGHVHHRHILYSLLRGAAVALLVLWALGWLTRQPWLFTTLGLVHTDNATGLLVASFIIGLAMKPLNFLSNWISRRNEFEADAFAKAKCGGEALASALVKLVNDSAKSLNDDPLYALMNYSHPPVPMRVARLLV
jgi:STE24 endopeptidase